MINPSQMACLEPLSALAPASLDRLAAIARIIDIERGNAVAAAVDWRGSVVYLLSGELKLEYPMEDGHHLVTVVVGGSGQGLLPVWIGVDAVKTAMSDSSPLRTLQVKRIQAITKCKALALDEESLDLVVTWDQLTAGASGNDVERDPAGSDANAARRPLSALCADQSLLTAAFANVPSANIPRLVSSFERMEVRRGQVILRQGGEGDFYYLIDRGRCTVTREIGGVASSLAELGDGEAFGEEALVSAAQRNATVTMKTDGVLWRLAKADFLTLLQEPLLQRISPTQARDGAIDSPIWLDTRFPVEFRQNGLAGAINVPLNEIRTAAAVLDKSRDYIVYCQTGRRSSAAAFLLSQRGIRAHLLDGGLNAMNELQEPVA